MEFPLSTVPSSHLLIVPHSRVSIVKHLLGEEFKSSVCALGFVTLLSQGRWVRFAPLLVWHPDYLENQNASLLEEIKSLQSLIFLWYLNLSYKSLLPWKAAWNGSLELCSAFLLKNSLPICVFALSSLSLAVGFLSLVQCCQVHRGAGPRLLAHQGKAHSYEHTVEN